MKTTNVAFLLDNTGSMHSIKDDVIGGFNGFLENQKTGKNKISFSMATFNSGEYKSLYKNVDIGKVKKLTEKSYQPGNMTPLLDSMAKLIGEVDKRKKEVLFVVYTDGYENDSREMTNKNLKKIVKAKEKLGWEFLFLGADIDAFGAAGMMGIKRGIKVDKGATHRNLAFEMSNSINVYAQSGKVKYGM